MRILSVLLLLIWGAMGMQDAPKPPAPTLKPTEMQSLKLQLKYKDALLAKQRLEALQTVIAGAQNDYQKAMSDYTEEANRVKAENKWPSDTTFDPNKVEFTPAPPPAPKETKKP